MHRESLFILISICALIQPRTQIYAGEMAMQRTLLLSPGKDNPRNSEGDFVQLRDGRILFVYTHFTGGSGDHDKAHLAGRFSSDGGMAWTENDAIVVQSEDAQNVMSVSLLRLRDDRIALFYGRKFSLSDCRPVVRFSSDEAQTWTDAHEIIPKSQNGYYVLNNDRVIQLKSGRLLVPVSRHDTSEGRWKKASEYGTVMCYLSDDGGHSWHRSKTQRDGYPQNGAKGKRVMLQEPGVVELKNGRVMMFCRTDAKSQYISFSDDQGESWTLFNSSNIVSPLSPASIERIPDGGGLLMVWNNHEGIPPGLEGKRTPLCVAISRDEGVNWENLKVLEDNPHGWYCYTAIHFVGKHVLLSYCAGDRRENNGLAVTQVTRFPLEPFR